MNGIRRVFRLPGTRRRIAREVEEELRFHIESRIEELERAGMSRADARELAHSEFGDHQASQQELIAIDKRRLSKRQHREQLMTFIDDIRYAARTLLRQPSLLIITVSALTAGIAANAVMFGVVDQLLLRAPAGISKPDELRRIYYQQRERTDGSSSTTPVTAYQMVTTLREMVPAFREISALARTSVPVRRGDEVNTADLEVVSGNYFNLLGIRPLHGRLLQPADDPVPNGEKVVVLGHRYWRNQFGAATNVVGQKLVIRNSTFVVVGVAPEGFSGIDRQNVDMWVPMSGIAADLNGDDWHNAPNAWWVRAIGRLGTNAASTALASASLEQAEQQATTQSTAALRAQLRRWDRPWMDTLGTVALGSIIVARAPNGMSAEGKVSLWLLGVSLLVLLIACANVANLLLARTLQRRREIAVRIALGVTRGRLLRMLLSESVLLAGISAIVALLIAYGAGQVVQKTMLPSMVWDGSIVDSRVMLFTLAVTVLTIVLAGLAPALQARRVAVFDGLRSSSPLQPGGRSRMRSTLVVVQAALSVVLLVGAGLFVKSLSKVSGRDVGVDLERVSLVRMNLAGAGFEREQISDVFNRAQERVASLPGVTEVTLVRGSAPLTMGWAMGFTIPGIDSLPELPGGGPYGSFIQSNFVPTIGARIVRGRNFTEEEERFPARVLIINELIAKHWFGDRDPVGACVMRTRDSLCTTIVGVMSDVMLFQMVRDDRGMVYAPSSMSRRNPDAMIVRSTGDAKAVNAAMRAELQRLAPNMPHVSVSTFAELVAPQLQPWRLGATMMSIMGSIALVIAIVGLYGVMAFLVAQRTHEIGVRMALGAQRVDVVRLIAWQSGRTVLLGLAAGLLVAAFAARHIGDLLYETSPRDPAIFLLAAGGLAVAAFLASVVPARRAASVDPARTLRADS